MDGLRKKILLDVCVTPSTIMPAILGVSFLLLSVILGSGWGFLGFCLCLVSLGFIGTRFLFSLESITKSAVEQLLAEKTKHRNIELDQLDSKLLLDRDPRDQTALRNLRALYDDFMSDAREGKICGAIPVSMHDQIEAIFQNCVTQLSKQHQMWLVSSKILGDSRKDLMLQRTKILDDVEASIEVLTEVMDEVRTLGLKSKQGELSELQNRLKLQLAAAKEIDRLTSVDPTDLSRFEEYQK